MEHATVQKLIGCPPASHSQTRAQHATGCCPVFDGGRSRGRTPWIDKPLARALALPATLDGGTQVASNHRRGLPPWLKTASQGSSSHTYRRRSPTFGFGTGIGLRFATWPARIVVPTTYWFISCNSFLPSTRSTSKSTPGMIISLLETCLSRMEQRRGTGTSGLSRYGFVFADTVHEANSLDDVRYLSVKRSRALWVRKTPSMSHSFLF